MAQRITLASDQRKKVEFTLLPRQLSLINSEGKRVMTYILNNVTSTI